MISGSLLSLFVENAVWVWLAVGLVCIVFELSLAPGIGLLFAGIGALSVAALLVFDLLLASQVEWQFILFCGFTLIWTLLLWKPFKRYINTGGKYNIYCGTTAQVQGNDLTKTSGTVRWSGANMRAKIHPQSSQDVIADGTEVFVHEMKDGVMLVDIASMDNNEQPQ